TKLRHVVSRGIPKHVIRHNIVAMDHHVAHSNNLSPRNILVMLAPLFRYMPCRLAYQFKGASKFLSAIQLVARAVGGESCYLISEFDDLPQRHGDITFAHKS